jgi:hypothetical protein
MGNNPRIRRLGLIRVSEPDEGVRRYLLARLDDISLATPHSNGNGNGNGNARSPLERSVARARLQQR